MNGTHVQYGGAYYKLGKHAAACKQCRQRGDHKDTNTASTRINLSQIVASDSKMIRSYVRSRRQTR